MALQFLDPAGVIVPVSALQIPRARALAEVLEQDRLLYVQLVECRRRPDADEGDREIVVMDVEVERPSQPVHPINRTERVAAVFTAADNWYPTVLALRADFPQVPHLNLEKDEFPRSLCLYDQPWQQVALRWTPTAFVERIRHWMAETAKGTLHQTDQPLEPLLFGNGYRIILPSNLFDAPSQGAVEQLDVSFATAGEDARVLIARRPPKEEEKRSGLDYLALSFTARPQAHGIIRHAPHNLAELGQFLSAAGVDLFAALREKLPMWRKENFLDKHLVLIVAFPLIRDGKDTVETTDLWCFLTATTIQQIGIAIGFWENIDGFLGQVLEEKPDADGREVPVDVLTPHFDFTRKEAAQLNGVSADERKVVAVGVGALGSQVVMHLARSGFGQWTTVDEDVLLPHNLARHALERSALGHSKALTMAVTVARLYTTDPGVSWIPTNILVPGKHRERLTEVLKEADVILDMAASIPVSRHLAYQSDVPGRRVALFLNPTGTDLVLLTEDRSRSVTIDCLEMQYYRAIASQADFSGHLDPPAGRLRYARSCRDVTSTIPNHLVALHAAIGSKAVRTAVNQDAAFVRVWRANPETLDVQAFSLPVNTVFRASVHGWTLVLDRHVLDRINALRTEKLPNETGGVLIGAFDLTRCIVYVVDTVPSPPDSKEWPTLYIRGSEGLAAEVAEIGRRTDGQLEYVGEWHSHPDQCSCNPSEDDLLVFSWLTENMTDAGLPALMAIAGQHGSSQWFLGEMLRGGGWGLNMN